MSDVRTIDVSMTITEAITLSVALAKEARERRAMAEAARAAGSREHIARMYVEDAEMLERVCAAVGAAWGGKIPSGL